MIPLIFDTENTGAQRNKANPFDNRNSCCCISFRSTRNDVAGIYKIEYDEDPYKQQLDNFQKEIDACDILVGFNLKYDLHWIKRYGILWGSRRVWDTQLFYFIQSNQTKRFPSLNDVAVHYGFPTKLDVVATEYWDKGLDTDQVPWDILEEYALYDAELTYNIFQKQYEEFKQLPKNRRNLILLQMKDLLVLQEMEYNGSKYNTALSIAMGNDLERKIGDIDAKLAGYAPKNIDISFNSDHQIGVFLFGGSLYAADLQEYTFTYKDGRTATKTRKVVREVKFPQIFKPRTKTKGGAWATDIDTLRTIGYNAVGFKKNIIDMLLTRTKLEKQASTYCFGTPKLLGVGKPKKDSDMGWQDDILHGNLNQTAVVTGRLSSNKPNLQNQDGKMKICFVSRF